MSEHPPVTPAPAPIARHRTAIVRPALSRPVRRALEDQVITHETSVFDYGCGQGGDIRLLGASGVACSGWDPAHRPDAEKVSADVVNLGYVVNVIEDPVERAATLRDAWALATRVLLVSARLASGANIGENTPLVDGVVTSRNTFQKYFAQQELRDWIDRTLEVASVPAAPGMVYVFREDADRNAFLVGRHSRRVSVPRVRAADALFEEHRAALEPLMEFVAARGRLPDPPEVENIEEIRKRFGTIRRAFNVVRKASGINQWGCIRESRAQDLLVYIALGRFTRRPPFSSLPEDLQRDIRTFFSTYASACSRADELLFSVGNARAIDQACRASDVGKLTPSALYIHESALSSLAPVLRVYEGCARVLVGVVEGANVVKFHRHEPRVAYLSYPEFDRVAHPGLAFSFAVNLQTFQESLRSYGGENPPVLHRKELFVASDYALRPKFAKLTEREEQFGLLEDSQGIGWRESWEARLRCVGFALSGHRLIRARRGATAQPE